MPTPAPIPATAIKQAQLTVVLFFVGVIGVALLIGYYALHQPLPAVPGDNFAPFVPSARTPPLLHYKNHHHLPVNDGYGDDRAEALWPYEFSARTGLEFVHYTTDWQLKPMDDSQTYNNTYQLSPVLPVSPAGHD